MKWQTLIRRKYMEAWRFVRFVIDHFIEDDCTYRASALAFTSLLAIVPLMSVGLSILTAFPVFQDLSGPVQDFIFENFVPTTGQVIQGYIVQFTNQVSRLSVIGVLFLFGSAILLMVTIERSMNKIWRVASPRHGVAAFLLYWAILSLAPVLLGLSLAASSYIISMPLIRDHQPASALFTIIPFFLSLFAFTFLFVVVPNSEVKIRHGFSGALVTTILFETAKFSFAYYLAQYNTYELLYGAFAAVPIFFIWVYWVWVITLLGTEISYALSVPHQRRRGYPLDGFSHALLWLNVLWQAQQEGRGVQLPDLIKFNEQPFDVDTGDMVKLLNKKKLVHSTDDNNYLLLSRDLNHLSLYELSQLLPYRMPAAEEIQEIKCELAERWKPVLRKNDKQMKESLSMNLSELFS